MALTPSYLTAHSHKKIQASPIFLSFTREYIFSCSIPKSKATLLTKLARLQSQAFSRYLRSSCSSEALRISLTKSLSPRIRASPLIRFPPFIEQEFCLSPFPHVPHQFPTYQIFSLPLLYPFYSNMKERS